MKRHLRALVSGGMLIPLEPIGVPDGSEVELTMDMPEAAKTIPPVVFGEWELGARQPLTRESIYEDVC